VLSNLIEAFNKQSTPAAMEDTPNSRAGPTGEKAARELVKKRRSLLIYGVEDMRSIIF
jgi:hypothetical protein